MNFSASVYELFWFLMIMSVENRRGLTSSNEPFFLSPLECCHLLGKVGVLLEGSLSDGGHAACGWTSVVARGDVVGDGATSVRMPAIRAVMVG